MISVTLRQIINSMEAFSELSQKEINARTAFNIARIINRLNIEYRLFCETRDKIVQKYAEKDENGQLKISEEGDFTVPKEDIAIFNKDFEDLFNTTIEMNLNPIPIEEIEMVVITPALLMSLEPFIKD